MWLESWQTHGDIPGLQQGMDRQGRLFPRHIPGSSQGMDGPGYVFFLCINPIHTLSCTSPCKAAAGREWLLRLGLPRSALALGSSGSACFGDKRCCVLPAVQLLPCRPGIALSPFRLVTKHLQGRGVEKSRDFCKQIVLLCYTESIVLIFLLCVVPQSSEASPDPAECVGLVARGVAVTPTPCAVHAALGTSMAELWGCC